MNFKPFAGPLIGAALIAFSALSAHAVEVAGIKLDDSVRVGGKELKLNGAGVRTRFVIKVYAMGLYLPEAKNSTEAVVGSAGPRRVTLGVLRELTGDDLRQAFTAGINANSDKAELAKLAPQLAQFNEAMLSIAATKKGDILHMDWVPETGMLINFNGKQLGEPIKELGFYNAVLKIWLGEKAVDSSLKPLLLGGK